nr:DUF2530 domain-containing protein [Nocardiopsis mwathae]
MESDYRVPTAIGTVAWVVALVVLVAMGDDLPGDERWWIWVCVVGIVLGVFAFLYIPRLLRKRQEAEERGAAKRREREEQQGRPAQDPAGPDSTRPDHP